MSTQQDIYAAGSKSRPPMLNKENYVPWSSRLLRYAKSRPNGKLIHNSIINGPYVKRMIPKPSDTNREVLVNETFHVQTDDELTEKELKQIKAEDQAIQTILLGLPEDIYAAVDSYETAQEIWLRVQQMMKGSDIGIQEKKAKLFNEWERFTSNKGESTESYYHHFLKLMNDLKRNKQFLEKIASNLKFLNNLQPEWSRHVTIVHQTKDLHTADYTQLYDFQKYNQKENYMQQPMPNPEDITNPTPAMNMIAQPGMNMGQDRQMQMVGGNGENQFRQYARQNVGNLNGYNDVQNVENQVAQNLRVQNGLIGVPGNANQNLNGNGNLVATQLLIAQKEEASIQLQAEEFDLMAAVADLDEIEEVNANCILMVNLQQALTSEEQYTELLEPIPESHQVPHNDSNVISEVTSVEQSRETVEQHPVNFEETRALYDSLYQSLAIEVEKVNTEKSTVSFLLEEKKKLKSDFKIREDEVLDKQIQLLKKIKELNNILVKTGQSIPTIHMLS
nr:hypothetical protein [Tanacetum cinerariifolium]